ncbi:MAG: efflux RND transporter periplasmic adaptor subunit [Planctomycetota bacterium]
MKRSSLIPSCAVVLALCGCEQGAPASADKAKAASARPPREVRVAEVGSVTWPVTLHLTGMLQPSELTTLRAEVAGLLTEISVDLGSRVEAGAALARIDDTTLRLDAARARAALGEVRARLGLPPRAPGEKPAGEGAASAAAAAPDEAALEPEAASGVRVAQAVLVEARARHARVQNLLAQGVETAAGLDTAEAALRVAESRLREAVEAFEADRALLAVRRSELALAEDRLRRATLRAPFAGVVVERLVSPGERLDVGAAVARLARTDPLRLGVDVPEVAGAKLRPGLTLSLRIDGLPGERSATVARVAPVIDADLRTRRFEADVSNPGGEVPGGAFARVELVTDASASALAAPASAVRTFAGIDKLLVVEPGKDGALRAHERTVRVGRRTAERVEVLSGVEAGARVVLEPGNLLDGAGVRVQD